MSDEAASDCIFCAIVAGQAEASSVYEEDQTPAFLDLNPVNAGHVLVVPKTHASGLQDLNEDLGSGLFRVAHRIGRALRHSELPCDGVNTFLADGEAAGQEVFHVHLQVFPRTTGDGFTVDADWRAVKRTELDAAAEHVKAGLARLTR